MSGKPYTMKEMRGIVDYLVERKAYSEVRGRKMWMDYARTGITNRTWQSLKETFLKRVLPDIHNPYYKLSQAEISSFREGRDVSNRLGSRLEFRSASGDTNSDVNNIEKMQPSTSRKINGEKETGEDVKCSKLPSNRDSVDTVILLPFDDNGPHEKCDNIVDKDNNVPVKKKSLRDCIIYDEPLTPLMQGILEDFQSEPEGDDDSNVGLYIDEENENHFESKSDDSEIEQNQSSDENRMEADANENNIKSSIKKSLKLKKVTKVVDTKTDAPQENQPAEKNDTIFVANSTETVVISSNGTPDSVIPNNQEGLFNNNKTNTQESIMGVNSKDQKGSTSPHKTEDAEIIAVEKICSTSPVMKKRLRSSQQKVDTEGALEFSSQKVNDAQNQEISSVGTKIQETQRSSPVLKKMKINSHENKINDTDQYNVKILASEKENDVQNQAKASTSAQIAEIKTSSTTIKKRKRKGQKSQNNSEFTKILASEKENEAQDQEVTPVTKIKETLSSASQDAKKQKKNDKETKSIDIEDADVLSSEKENDAQEPVKASTSRKAKERLSLESQPTQKQQVNIHQIKNTNENYEALQSAEENQEKDSTGPKTTVPNPDKEMVNDATKGVTATKQIVRNIEVKSAQNCQVKTSEINEKYKENIRKIDNSEIFNISVTNPCLQSVSLFDEEFKPTLSCNLDSESDELKNKLDNNKIIKTVDNDVVELISNSSKFGSGSEVIRSKEVSMRDKRKEVLNNLFRSASGGGASRRYRTRSGHRHDAVVQQLSSGSSESESSSDSEAGYVSPPRSRNRRSRKYMKPVAARILEHEGGLFVACNRKVYPIVQDGRGGKNYLSCLSDNEAEEDSYWKKKYVEERKKTELLTKLLEEKDVNQRLKNEELAYEPASPILLAKPPPRLEISDAINSLTKNEVSKVEEIPRPKKVDEEAREKNVPVEKPEDKHPEKVVVKYSNRDKEEVSIEGHWPDLQPILTNVLHHFRRPVSSSRSSTPIIFVPIAQEGRNMHEIEEEIFEEIENKAIEDEEVDDEEEDKAPPVEKQSHITKRKRQRIQRSDSPKKRQKVAEDHEEERDSDTEIRVEEGSKEGRRRRGRPAKTVESSTSPRGGSESRGRQSANNERVATQKSSLQRTRSVSRKRQQPPAGETEEDGHVSKRSGQSVSVGRSASRRRAQADARDAHAAVDAHAPVDAHSDAHAPVDAHSDAHAHADADADSEDTALYRFPSPERQPRARAAAAPRSLKTRNNYKIPPSSELLKVYSPDTSLGYRESDDSPMSNNIRNRNMKQPTQVYRRKYTRKSLRLSHDIHSDASNESSNSLPAIPAPNNNETTNTEVHRSESYSLLLPRHRTSHLVLPKIPEVNQCPNEVRSISECDTLHLSPAPQNLDFRSDKSGSSLSINVHMDNGNSSSVSLPLSPELSIVENISINKSTLVQEMDHPILNETGGVEANIASGDFVLTQVDISVPLMEQVCGFKPQYRDNNDTGVSHVSTQVSDSIDNDVTDGNTKLNPSKGTTVTESLLSKIDTVSLEEQLTASESLGDQLKKLLLESAKKNAGRARRTRRVTDSAMSVDKSEVESLNKAKKKRCSTPRKKKDVKTQPAIVENVIVEEQMEFCNSGRKSCPPIVYTVFEQPTNNEGDETANVTKTRGKRTKDVIKVKILRPKDKKNKTNPPNKTRKTRGSKLSVPFDSGINDTATSAIMENLNQTVDLIHNHSETCLQANECFVDSVEYVENSSDSVISINSSSSECEANETSNSKIGLPVGLPPELFSSDAQDGSSHSNESSTKLEIPEDVFSQITEYLTPVSPSSLLTEDLSDDPTRTKKPGWFLLSEEENTISNMDPAKQPLPSYYGSNLKQIFPITCSVPNLSTITEMSDANSRQNTNFNTDTESRSNMMPPNPKSPLVDDVEDFMTCPDG